MRVATWSSAPPTRTGLLWVTPVWFPQSDYRRFIWVSSPERRHSRNVRMRPEVSIVLFDSRVVVGSARAVSGMDQAAARA